MESVLYIYIIIDLFNSEVQGCPLTGVSQGKEWGHDGTNQEGPAGSS